MPVKTVKCLKEWVGLIKKGKKKKKKTLWLMQIWYSFLKQLVFSERFSLDEQLWEMGKCKNLFLRRGQVPLWLTGQRFFFSFLETRKRVHRWPLLKSSISQSELAAVQQEEKALALWSRGIEEAAVLAVWRDQLRDEPRRDPPPTVVRD